MEEATKAFGEETTGSVTWGRHLAFLSLTPPPANKKAEPASQSGCEVQGGLSLPVAGGRMAPKDVHVLIPEPVTILGYIAKGS